MYRTKHSKKYGRGSDEVNADTTETEKRPRGRPKKETEIITPIEPIIKKRVKYENVFASNIVDNLNNVLTNLRLEYYNIKNKEADPVLKKEEIKRIKKMEKDISKIYLSCN